MDMVYFAGDGNVESFWVDQNPVQNSMFAKFVQETGYQTDAEKNGFGYVWTSLGEKTNTVTRYVAADGKQHTIQEPYEAYEWKQVGDVSWKDPRYEDSYKNTILYIQSDDPSSYDIGDIVLQVSWNDAKAYCNWAGKDLLTVSEWNVIFNNGLEFGRFSIYITDSLGYRFYIYEWADDKIESRNRAIVFGAQLLEKSIHSLTSVPGFVEYRSANILTFRCKE